MKQLTKENILKNQVDTIEQFKVLDYLKKQLSIDEFVVYLIDRFTMKVVDKNNEQGYFKYNTKTKSVDFYEKNIKNKEIERWKMKITYTRIGDYNLPNVILNSPSNLQINKYGRLRLDYIKENNKSLYTTLLMKNELTNHLISVSIEAENRLNSLMEQYKNSDKLLSEKGKMDNQIEWVKLINNYKNMAEEIILKELIYVWK